MPGSVGRSVWREEHRACPNRGLACLLAVLHPAAPAGAPRNQDRQLEVRLARQIERDLLIGKQTICRMLERALAAFAFEDPLFVPESSERRASMTQLLDEQAKRRLMQMRAAR